VNYGTKDHPRFSIVIPTYHSDLLLLQCLDSLSQQCVDHTCFEVLVVNDGGNKQLSKSIEPFRSRLPLTYLYQSNKGPAAARNVGIQKAKGEIILFLDDDSLPARDWLKSTIAAWEAQPNCDGIGGYILHDERDSIYCRVNTDFFNWYFKRHSDNGRSAFLSTCNAGYTKSILNRVGLFDETFKGASGEDRDLNIKASQAGAKLILDETILVYHDRDLTLRSFAKKYFNYGIAAKVIFDRYPNQERMRLSDYFSLCSSVSSGYRNLLDKLVVFFLLTLSQAASFLGHHMAVFNDRHRRL